MGYITRKKLNNNVILVDDSQGDPVILIGRGIGFNAQDDMPFSQEAKVDRKFVLSEENNKSRFRELVWQTDPNLIAMIEESLKSIQDRCGFPLNENVHSTLCDHIAFALERHRKGIDFANPFNEDLKYVYPDEYAFAAEIVEKVNRAYHVTLAEDETGIVAIHLRAAELNESIQLSRKKAALIEQTIAALHRLAGVLPDKGSVFYQRALVHCRMAYERILQGQPMGDSLVDMIRREYEAEFCQIRSALDLIAQQNQVSIPDSEAAYLVIHLKRLDPTCPE